MATDKKSIASIGTEPVEAKTSWWKRLRESKENKPISDEDMEKYLGRTRKDLNQWADSQPGVGRNQLAGKLVLGEASGFGGLAAADGYGGWGPSAEPLDSNRGMKFPPTQAKDKELTGKISQS